MPKLRKLARKPESFSVETPSGVNTELIGLRVPKELYELLQAEAERDSTSIQEVTRNYLWYHFTPALVGLSLVRLQESDLRELSSVERLTALAANYRQKLERLEKIAEITARVREEVHVHAEIFEQISGNWTAELEAFLKEIDAAEEQLEAALSLEEETEGEVA